MDKGNINSGQEFKDDPRYEKQGNQVENLPINSILDFHKYFVKLIKWDELDAVEFAMWFAREHDEFVGTSPLIDQWTTVYSLCRNYWSYITADLMKIFKLVSDDSFRMDLPDEMAGFPFLSPDNHQCILSLSREKGIRFHFAQTIPLAWTAKFMHDFISYCAAWVKYVEYYESQKDEDQGFENWWLHTLRASMAVEKEEPLTAVGRI